jgi:hypothetical protein
MLTVLIVPLAVWAVTPFPLQPQMGLYKAWLNSIYCFNYDTCVHEVGHQMDYENGNPSQTHEFSMTIIYILATETESTGLSDHASVFFAIPGFILYSEDRVWWSDPLEEAYATYYMWAGGDLSKMHPRLRPFYSDDPKYNQLISCLSRNLAICGTAVRIDQDVSHGVASR